MFFAGLGWFVVTHRDPEVSVFAICAGFTAGMCRSDPTAT
jgi:hypothetical protein